MAANITNTCYNLVNQHRNGSDEVSRDHFKVLWVVEVQE